MPHVQGFYILHEGLIGVVDDGGLEEISYQTALENPAGHVQERRMAGSASPTNIGRPS